MWLNPLIGWLPLGTLVQLGWRTVGGVALARFELHPQYLRPSACCVTGFLGGLTTFPFFCRGYWGCCWQPSMPVALIAALLHLLGSLAMTVLGVSMVRLWL